MQRGQLDRTAVSWMLWIMTARRLKLVRERSKRFESTANCDRRTLQRKIQSDGDRI